MGQSIVTIQPSLSSGELSPSLRGRTDLQKERSGTTTCRNFFANYRGGVSSRAGLAYVGTCKQPGTSAPPRDIPFQFSLNQGYVLEFGDLYMRIKTDGAYVTEAPITVFSVSSTGVFTTVGPHGLTTGDWVYDLNNTGFSGLTWIVTVTSGVTFTVKNLFGVSITSATASSGGTISRIYTVAAPYAAVDLPYLKYTQSADVMTLTCVNQETLTEYPPYSLVRNALTNWTFTEETFTADISPPSGLSVQAQSSGVATTWYSYVVTAVDGATGEESVASTPVSVQNNDIAVARGSNILSWNTVPGAASYNVYIAPPTYGVTVPVSSLYGFAGTALGTSFTDTNISADFSRVPPQHRNPFALGEVLYVVPTVAGTNYSQSTIGYSVTTATGTGFSGVPVVSNSGGLSGFVIYNHGEGYLPGDTISFSDSGGGRATGTVTFTSNPTDAQLMTMGGMEIKWSNDTVLSPDTGENFIYAKIEATKELTAQSLANKLNASNILSFSVASYSVSGAVITVTYKTPGAVGNAYTLVATTSPVTVSGATLTGGGTAGSGAAATLTIGPQEDTYPSVAAYFQQRRVYAGSLSQPDTYWMSKPGLYENMDSSTPVSDGDAITGTPWAQQVNGIQWLVPMPGGLVTLTGKGAWQVNGGQEAAITPSNQTAVPQAYNGSSATVPPIVINYDLLYVQSKGSAPRDLAYNFYTNIYTGTDLTVMSNHLFNNYQIVQWAWAEEPYKLLWCVRSDGTLLCLTFLKEQEVYSWTRHDTNGLFVSVCSVTEPPVDSVYVITKRYVQGAWRYYSERMDDRLWENIEDSFCVDSGLTTPMTYPAATLSPSAASGSNIVFSATANVFTSDNIGDIIRVGGGKATIISLTSGSVVRCDITEDIVDVVPNDPNEMPVPALSGEWSISTPITVVSGLNHLNGKEVCILADGSVSPNQVVTSNQITLPYAASKIVVGLPYTCQVQTTNFDVPTAATVQNKRKNISSVGIRVESTRGIQVGADQPDASSQPNYANIPWDDMNEVKERTGWTFAGTAVPLYTGDYFKNIVSGWNVNGQVAVQQTYPLPANILAIIFYVTLGDD